MATALSAPQQELLARAQHLRTFSNEYHMPYHGVYVQGPTHRSAAALERKGHGVLIYQGPGRGWFRSAE